MLVQEMTFFHLKDQMLVSFLSACMLGLLVKSVTLQMNIYSISTSAKMFSCAGLQNLEHVGRIIVVTQQENWDISE